MPRDLPVGNGNLLVAFDSLYHIRELYSPYVGQANHTQGSLSRFGVWADGAFSWVHDPCWERTLLYEPDTLVTAVTLLNRDAGLALHCSDCVAYDHDIYIRSIEVENLRPLVREVRLFFHLDLNIGGSSDGDTALYHPNERAVLHYKGMHWFLASAATDRQWGVTSYATGIIRHHGAAGTWRDAEDGHLGRNPIAQGSVDSTICCTVRVSDRARAYYWIAAGRNQVEVSRLNRLLHHHGAGSFVSRVRTYWKQWASARPSGAALPDAVHDLYRRSLLVIRTQTDNRGAILAANDSDTLEYNRDSYSYLWPRDGALVAHALDLAGYHDVTARFFALCPQLLTEAGYFMHKYNPDGSVGSSWHPWCGMDGSAQLPIQQDETALVLWALWDHFQAWRNVDFIRTLYRSLIEPAGDWLCSFRNVRTGLPDLSWDLWEERRGIHTFTVGAVWAGLTAAANFARMFGDERRASRFHRAAEVIRAAVEQHLFSPELGRYVRGLSMGDGGLAQDTTLDASLCGLFLFGMFSPEEPRVGRTMDAVESCLRVKTHVGGIARYARDSYYRIAEDQETVPGNPWFLCTLWTAQRRIAAARSVEELKAPQETLEWVVRHAFPSGVLAEQLHPYTGAPISVSPLTWSHATFVSTVCQWEAAYRRLTDRRRSR